MRTRIENSTALNVFSCNLVNIICSPLEEIGQKLNGELHIILKPFVQDHKHTS